MKSVLRVTVLAVLTTLFYAYVGHMVPQKVTYPPESVELRHDMTTDEMVAAGREIVEGKGICLTCHTIGSDKAGRFPDLGGIGARAATRKEGMSAVEYIAESLYEPNAYIVEGFNPGMITVTKPPVSLNDQEILSVIAYLQSLGSTPTVTMDTKLKYAGTAPSTTAAPASAAAAGAGDRTGKELVEAFGCIACHNFEAPVKGVGPSLYDAGKRLSHAQLYESIMEPDASVAEGFTPGLMATTLQGMQFYEKVSAIEVKTIVEYLSSLKGS